MSIEKNLSAISDYLNDRTNQVLSINDQGNLISTRKNPDVPSSYVAIPYSITDKDSIRIHIEITSSTEDVEVLVRQTLLELQKKPTANTLHERVVSQLQNTYKDEPEFITDSPQDIPETQDIPEPQKKGLVRALGTIAHVFGKVFTGKKTSEDPAPRPVSSTDRDSGFGSSTSSSTAKEPRARIKMPSAKPQPKSLPEDLRLEIKQAASSLKEAQESVALAKRELKGLIQGDLLHFVKQKALIPEDFEGLNTAYKEGTQLLANLKEREHLLENNFKNLSKMQETLTNSLSSIKEEELPESDKALITSARTTLSTLSDSSLDRPVMTARTQFIQQKESIDELFAHKLDEAAKAVEAIKTDPTKTVFIFTENGTITTRSRSLISKKSEFVITRGSGNGIYCDAPKEGKPGINSAQTMRSLFEDLVIYGCQPDENYGTIPGSVGKAANALGQALIRFAIPPRTREK